MDDNNTSDHQQLSRAEQCFVHKVATLSVRTIAVICQVLELLCRDITSRAKRQRKIARRNLKHLVNTLGLDTENTHEVDWTQVVDALANNESHFLTNDAGDGAAERIVLEAFHASGHPTLADEVFQLSHELIELEEQCNRVSEFNGRKRSRATFDCPLTPTATRSSFAPRGSMRLGVSGAAAPILMTPRLASCAERFESNYSRPRTGECSPTIQLSRGSVGPKCPSVCLDRLTFGGVSLVSAKRKETADNSPKTKSEEVEAVDGSAGPHQTPGPVEIETNQQIVREKQEYCVVRTENSDADGKSSSRSANNGVSAVRPVTTTTTTMVTTTTLRDRSDVEEENDESDFESGRDESEWSDTTENRAEFEHMEEEQEPETSEEQTLEEGAIGDEEEVIHEEADDEEEDDEEEEDDDDEQTKPSKSVKEKTSAASGGRQFSLGPIVEVHTTENAEDHHAVESQRPITPPKDPPITLSVPKLITPPNSSIPRLQSMKLLTPLARLQEKLGFGSFRYKSKNFTEEPPRREDDLEDAQSLTARYLRRQPTPRFSKVMEEEEPEEGSSHENAPPEQPAGPPPKVCFHRFLKPLLPKMEIFTDQMLDDRHISVASWARGLEWHKTVKAQRNWNPHSLFGCGVRVVTFSDVFQTPDFRRVPRRDDDHLGKTEGRATRNQRWEVDRMACGFREADGMSREQLAKMIQALGKTTDISDLAYQDEWIPCDETCSHDAGRKQPWYREAPFASV